MDLPHWSWGVCPLFFYLRGIHSDLCHAFRIHDICWLPNNALGVAGHDAKNSSLLLIYNHPFDAPTLSRRVNSSSNLSLVILQNDLRKIPLAVFSDTGADVAMMELLSGVQYPRIKRSCKWSYLSYRAFSTHPLNIADIHISGVSVSNI